MKKQILKVISLNLMNGKDWKNHNKGAWNTFACSYDLINWTDWSGEYLVQSSEDYDSRYAHKSCVIKHDGVVYHFYCSVDKNNRRGIALATSKDLGKSKIVYPPLKDDTN